MECGGLTPLLAVEAATVRIQLEFGDSSLPRPKRRQPGSPARQPRRGGVAAHSKEVEELIGSFRQESFGDGGGAQRCRLR